MTYQLHFLRGPGQKSDASEPRHQNCHRMTSLVSVFLVESSGPAAIFFPKRGEKSEMNPRSSQREQYPASALKRVTHRYRRVVRATDLSPGVTTGQAPVRTVIRQTPPAPPGHQGTVRAPRYEDATSPARATAPDEVGRAPGPKVSRARVSHRVGGRTSRINSLVKRATGARKGAEWSGGFAQ